MDSVGGALQRSVLGALDVHVVLTVLQSQGAGKPQEGGQTLLESPCFILGKSFNFSVPLFSHPKMGITLHWPAPSDGVRTQQDNICQSAHKAVNC